MNEKDRIEKGLNDLYIYWNNFHTYMLTDRSNSDPYLNIIIFFYTLRPNQHLSSHLSSPLIKHSFFYTKKKMTSDDLMYKRYIMKSENLTEQ